MKYGRNDKCICGSGKKFKKCCLPLFTSSEKVTYKNIGLVVGNGFTIDFISNFIGLSQLHSSYPLKNFNSNNISYTDFIDRIPDVRDKLLNKAFENDFDAISNFIANYPVEDIAADCQLRRFLAIAYSLFQIELNNYKDKYSLWKWSKWINANKEKLGCAISFNYDILLENILQHNKTPYFRAGAVNETIGKPIIKPHGSLDFDIADGFVGGTFDTWNIQTKLNDNNGYVKTIKIQEWLKPRLEADIIPPSQENYQLNLGWVKKGYKLIEEITKNMDAIVIIGFSYASPDRKEFNKIIELIPSEKSLDFYLVNPNVFPELVDYLKSRGHNVKVVQEGLPW